MANFGERSLSNLDTCHEDIKLILGQAIQYYDFSVICGIRNTAEQQRLFHDGKSQLDGINRKSKHQGRPNEDGEIVSFAVDIMPYKSGTNAFSGDEKDNRRFYYLMGIIKAISEHLLTQGFITHKVTFGLDWDGDDIYKDQNFDDMPHVQIDSI